MGAITKDIMSDVLSGKIKDERIKLLADDATRIQKENEDLLSQAELLRKANEHWQKEFDSRYESNDNYFCDQKKDNPDFLVCPNCRRKNVETRIQIPPTYVGKITCPVHCGWEIHNPDFKKNKCSISAL